MRVLLSTQPAVGHFHPMVPIARALADAGHEPVFATSASFRPYVERTGFPSVAAGADWLASDPGRAFPDLVGDRPTAAHLSGTLPAVFARAARHLMPDLRRLVGSMRPDVVLAESTEWVGALAAEAGGVPHAQLGITALHPLPVLARALGRYWNMARLALGLPDDPRLERLCPHLYLDLYPPSMQPHPVGTLLPNARLVRPTPYQVAAGAAPSWLARLPARPTVVVTMGTLFNRVEGVYEAVIEALRDEPLTVIVLLGPDRDPDAWGPVPANVRLAGYIPQSLLMPRTDLVITHGGFNTVVTTLGAGIPLLCLPLGGDQRSNAARVAAAGAGVTLDHATADPAAIGRAVKELLTDDAYRRNAERLGAEIMAMPPTESAVPHLESLATVRQR
jgi:UDP:flavonoid glycosyltransferase YjiC (YdhE family)